MSLISTAIRDVSITIGGTDVTECLIRLELQHPDIDIGQPSTCTGSIELSDTFPLQSFSLDERENSIFCRQSEVIVNVRGVKVATMYLTNYRYWRRRGTGKLIDALTLLDVDRAEFEVPEISIEAGTPMGTVVLKLLQEAGKDAEGNTVFTNFGSFQLTGVANVPLTSTNPIADAQTYCAADLKWLYVDEEGQIKSLEYPRSVSSVISLSLDEVVEFEPDPTQDDPIGDRVTVYGSHDEAVPSVDENEEGMTEEEKILYRGTYFDAKGRPILVTTTTRGPRANAYPGVDWTVDSVAIGIGSEEIILEEKEIEYKYANDGDNIIEGSSVQYDTTITTKREPQGVVYPNTILDWQTALTYSQLITTEIITEDAVHKKIERCRGFLFPQAADPTDFSVLWEQLIVFSEEEIDPGVPVPGDREPEKEPTPKTEFEIKTVEFIGEADIDLDCTPLLKVPIRENVGYLYDQGQADRMAEWFAEFYVQSANAWFLSTPCYTPLLSNFKRPFVGALVAGKSLILTAAELVIEASNEQSSMTLKYTGRERGNLSGGGIVSSGSAGISIP